PDSAKAIDADADGHDRSPPGRCGKPLIFQGKARRVFHGSGAKSRYPAGGMRSRKRCARRNFDAIACARGFAECAQSHRNGAAGDASASTRPHSTKLTASPSENTFREDVV